MLLLGEGEVWGGAGWDRRGDDAALVVEGVERDEPAERVAEVDARLAAELHAESGVGMVGRRGEARRPQAVANVRREREGALRVPAGVEVAHRRDPTVGRRRAGDRAFGRRRARDGREDIARDHAGRRLVDGAHAAPGRMAVRAEHARGRRR